MLFVYLIFEKKHTVKQIKIYRKQSLTVLLFYLYPNVFQYFHNFHSNLSRFDLKHPNHIVNPLLIYRPIDIPHIYSTNTPHSYSTNSRATTRQ